MRQFFFFLFTANAYLLFAQENNTGIPIPMKNGIIYYETTVLLKKSSAGTNFYAQAREWLQQTFPEAKQKVDIFSATGQLTTKVEFKIITDETAGHYYWMKPTVVLSTKGDSCSLKLFSYYEKPIMPGVTNDYSKIEYRWWDFRKGKPWNNEDTALFKGIDQQSVGFIDSFQKKFKADAN